MSRGRNVVDDCCFDCSVIVGRVCGCIVEFVVPIPTDLSLRLAADDLVLNNVADPDRVDALDRRLRCLCVSFLYAIHVLRLRDRCKKK